MKNIKARDISKIIIKGLLVTGAIAVASTSPYFLPRVLPKIIRHIQYENRKRKKVPKAAYYNAFYYLKKNGDIHVARRNGQIFISLTEEGKAKAGKYQIDNLKIEKPKKWDGQWRILIFDIPDNAKIKREALRGKIKELGLIQLQKSVWVYPYEFDRELSLLRSFFGLNEKEMQFMLASKIEYDKEIKKHFHLA